MQSSQAVTNGVMALTNMLDQEVKQQNGLQGTDLFFDFSGMAKGVYLLYIGDASGSLTRKILIE